jgi:translation initiation factor IF-2
MNSGKTTRHQKRKEKKHLKRNTGKKESRPLQAPEKNRLEIVLKCDTSGCAEAIISSINYISHPEVKVDIISSGLGSINKSDIFMAETGSRLIVGFNVGYMPHVDELASEHNIEIRLYDVIYRLIEDIESITVSLLPQKHSEQVVGSAKVIALFKSSRKGIILGCEIMAGKLSLQQPFRVVGAMGIKYTGIIESLHIEKDAVREATRGHRVGLKIRNFNRGRIGDLVESFETKSIQHVTPWHPQGRIFYP